jgi:hypothetical protein
VGGVVGGLVLYNLVAATTNYWLGYWADNVEQENGTGGGNLPSSVGLSVYASLSFFSIFVSFFAVLSSTLAGQRACRHFHEAIVAGSERERERERGGAIVGITD